MISYLDKKNSHDLVPRTLSMISIYYGTVTNQGLQEGVRVFFTNIEAEISAKLIMLTL